MDFVEDLNFKMKKTHRYLINETANHGSYQVSS